MVAISLIGVGVVSTLGALGKFNSIAATSRNATGAMAVLMNQVDLFQSMGPFNPQPSKNEIPKDPEPLNIPPTYDMTVGTHIIGYKDPTRDTTTTYAIDPCSLPASDSDTWPVYREPARWTYANAVARLAASGFTATDRGQLAYQSDTKTYWQLQTTLPATWIQDTTGVGIIVKGTMTCTVTDISTSSMPNTYKAVFTIGYTYGSRDVDPITHLGKGGPIWNPAYKPCSSRPAVGRWEYQLSMTVIRTSDI